MQDTLLSLQHISKNFGEGDVLRDISLDVARGEFVTLLGASGCGKTTTLRIISGLETPDEGTVLLDGRDVTALPPERRPVNTVFQSYALFPHMNVEKNVAYGLRVRRMDKASIEKRVREMLELVQMADFAKRMPSQLSGGQRQRIAIARALAPEPELLLLDEPLGALDLQLRRQMQLELKRLQKKLGITFVYITHDQEEALNMSDRIAVMHDGRFEQIGSPEEIYERPATRFAAGFIGQTNLLACTVEAGGLLAFCGERFPALVPEGMRPGDQAALCLRMERLCYGSRAPEGHWSLPATLVEHRFAGGSLRTTLTAPDGQTLTAFSQTRPAVKAQNAQSSHSTCNATSTMVMVARLRMRLKNFTIGSRNIRLPPFALHYNIRQYSAVCAVLQVMQKSQPAKPLQAVPVGMVCGVRLLILPFCGAAGSWAAAPGWAWCIFPWREGCFPPAPLLRFQSIPG